jgi:hypothetical protein
VRFEDARLLREWALMQYDRVAPRVPGLDLTCERSLVHKSEGFKKLRGWFVRLSPAAKERARRWLQQQVQAVRTVINEAAARGEVLTAADIEDINFITEGDDDGTERNDTTESEIPGPGGGADGDGAPGSGAGRR